MTTLTRIALSCALSAAALPTLAQPSPAAPDMGSSAQAGWRQCAALDADQARLACFDQWAGGQPAPTAPGVPQASSWNADPGAATPVLTLAPAAVPPAPPIEITLADGCRDEQHSTLARFWELEDATDCGKLRFRGYRPMSVSVVAASSVNRQPLSENPINSAGSSVDYRSTEMRVQLSVRTKLATGLLPTRGGLRDSLWAGYTQQSYWQLFSPGISRPFRNTDHEPEVMYVYPTDAKLPFGWRWRYSGIGLVHQSNGQSDPLSRSWNRTYLMTGLELDDRFSLTARVWKRIKEGGDKDNNPGIVEHIGRAEFALGWNVNRDHRLTLTTRHALAGSARGSVRLDWMQVLGGQLVGPRSNLRLHTQLFSGYGDSLVDYNRKRTVFSVGLSLVDF
ncbi:phospholipase A [Melaminivora jejuensis]|uniref:phospholipase A n=1 Tax=Melaminivora jejuensis TaxID=1267217 RepID=UPI001ADEFBA3|nr:phospholipase A [Melaminivora jejuensis]UHJ64677.1 phospholipase A [Melaminivora jejuensis]